VTFEIPRCPSEKRRSPHPDSLDLVRRHTGEASASRVAHNFPVLRSVLPGTGARWWSAEILPDVWPGDGVPRLVYLELSAIDAGCQATRSLITAPVARTE